MPACCNTYNYSFTITRSNSDFEWNVENGRVALEERRAKDHEGVSCEPKPYTYRTETKANTFTLIYEPSEE